MKQVTATVVKLAPIIGRDGSIGVLVNGQLRTHRLTLALSRSFEEAIALCATIRREDKKTVSFCGKRPDGKFYDMNLTPAQVNLLCNGQISAENLGVYAPGLTFSAVVELRQPGDPYIDRATKTEKFVGKNGFAQVQNMTIAIPQHIQDTLSLNNAIASAFVKARLSATATASAPQQQTVTNDQPSNAHIDTEPPVDEAIAPEGDTTAPPIAPDQRERVDAPATTPTA